MRVHPGSRIGRYEVIAAVGAGGMGEVYRALDVRLHREIALKVLPAESLKDETARMRLIREARLAASLNHPSICTIHDVGEEDGSVYLAMELVAGKSIAELLPPGGFPVERVLRYGTRIAGALAHAHSRHVVHRDIKSTNVLLTPDGQIKVLDFGLATRPTSGVNDATRSAASLDEPGSVAGTLAYMSPEAVRGDVADARSDVWSLGVLLYEMAAGRRPFLARSAADLTSAILRDPPAPLLPTVLPGLTNIIGRCLQKQPSERYADAGAVCAALEAVQGSTSRPRSTARWLFTAAAVALIALVAIAGARLGLRDAATRPVTAIHALAVLPLENLSGDPADDYLADGLTEELINRLSRLPGLTVTARTTVMRYKGSRLGVSEIARDLGVRAVVEGTVTRAPDRLRVTARLVDASTERSLWSDRYDRALDDVVVIQADVASSIATAIRSNLTPEERSRLTALEPASSEAYDFYLRGRFHAARENPDDNRQAISFFERAIAADERFAAARAELGRAYGQRVFYYAPDETALHEQAFVQIERALALDPSLDIAHLARGLLLWQPVNQFPHDRAIASFRRAIELNPSADEAHHQLGLVYMHIGLLDEALHEIREATRLNPANTLARFREGVIYLYQARYDQALQVFTQTPSGFQPPLVAFQASDALFHLGRKAEARAMTAAYLEGNSTDLGGVNTALQAMFAADAGDTSTALSLIRAAQDKGKGYGHFHHTAFTIARAYARAGLAGDAVQWLQQAADTGYPCYPAFENDVMFDRIRNTPVFRDFMTAQRTRWEQFKKPAL
jgi:non-specific serine/threonine protein kinase